MEGISTRQVKAPVVNVSDTSAEDRLLEFAEKNIEKMRGYTKLGNGPVPGFYELNAALMEYSNIQASLISLDVIAKIECDKATEEFKEWQAQRYLDARSVLNPVSMTASKWYSASELDAYVRNRYKDEYSRLHKAMACAEMKVALIRRLLDMWDKQSLVLNRLCKNVETEMASQFNGNGLGLNQG